MAPSADAAAGVAVAAGEVWTKAMRAVEAGGDGSGGGVLGGLVDGVVGGAAGGGGGAGTAAGGGFARKASVTVVLKQGGYIRCD